MHNEEFKRRLGSSFMIRILAQNVSVKIFVTKILIKPRIFNLYNVP